MSTNPNLIFPQLSEEDWNFTTEEQVPDNELVPCLLWEYLRESQTARQLVKEWRALFTAAPAENQDQSILAVRTQSLTIKINHELKIPEFLYSAIALVRGYHNLDNLPWRRLPANVRAFLRKPCEEVNPPAFIGLEMHVSELADDTKRRFDQELAKIPDTNASATLDELQQQSPLRFPEARATLHNFKNPDSYYEAFCLVVDWARYDNSAIRAELHNLVEQILESRPSGVEPQMRSGWTKRAAGANSQLRGRLRSLARARLHWRYNGPSHIKQALPAAYDWLTSNLTNDKGPTAVRKSLSDGAARCKRAFWEILPFERGNNPLSLTEVPSYRRISRSVPEAKL